MERLQDILRQMLDIVEVIPLSAEVMSASLWYQQELRLSPQDSIVYASVLTHLSQKSMGRKVFLNRNSKDFDEPDVEDELTKRGCKILFSFEDGFGYVQHQLGMQTDS